MRLLHTVRPLCVRLLELADGAVGRGRRVADGRAARGAAVLAPPMAARATSVARPRGIHERGCSEIAPENWLKFDLSVQEEAGRREARRMRGEARAALKRFAGTSPLPFVQFARIEHAAGDQHAARRAALHALRAALRAQPAGPVALYVARVCGELAGDVLGAWATASAALALPLPPDELLGAPPPRDLLQRALQECEARCLQLEQQPDDGHPIHVLDALLPSPAEWAAARARLAPPARRADLVRHVLTQRFTQVSVAGRARACLCPRVCDVCDVCRVAGLGGGALLGAERVRADDGGGSGAPPGAVRAAAGAAVPAQRLAGTRYTARPIKYINILTITYQTQKVSL